MKSKGLQALVVRQGVKEQESFIPDVPMISGQIVRCSQNERGEAVMSASHDINLSPLLVGWCSGGSILYFILCGIHYERVGERVLFVRIVYHPHVFYKSCQFSWILGGRKMGFPMPPLQCVRMTL